jgi:hypothetical protein
MRNFAIGRFPFPGVARVDKDEILSFFHPSFHFWSGNSWRFHKVILSLSIFSGVADEKSMCGFPVRAERLVRLYVDKARNMPIWRSMATRKFTSE